MPAGAWSQCSLPTVFHSEDRNLLSAAQAIAVLTTSKALALSRAIGWLGRDIRSLTGSSDRVSRPANTYCSAWRLAHDQSQAHPSLPETAFVGIKMPGSHSSNRYTKSHDLLLCLVDIWLYPDEHVTPMTCLRCVGHDATPAIACLARSSPGATPLPSAGCCRAQTAAPPRSTVTSSPRARCR